MITDRNELKLFLAQDAKASKHKGIKPHIFGDEIWKFQYSFRMLDYHLNRKRRNLFSKMQLIKWKLLYHHYSIKLGFSISYKATIGKGFSIAHYGSIVIHGSAIIGDNCRVHEGVCIGATNGSDQAATIGNNVFIATGAKIIGNIKIADDVAIGANAVVTKDILIPSTTWGGIPAKQISSNDSHFNLSPLLNLN